MLALYFAPGSSSMAVHIALHEIGIPFDPRPVSFAKKEQRTPEFLALNPEGKVPVLLADERPITEVAAILFYLAKKFPESNLLPPQNIDTDVQALSWMSFIAATVHPARGQGLERVRQVLLLADKKLEGREWAIGSYSVADIHLFRLYWRMNGMFHFAPTEFPSLSLHYDRMMARPSVRRTIEIEKRIGYELPQ